MLEISGGPINAPVPDDLTVPQFFLDAHHPLRPVRKTGVPWLVEDATGRPIDCEEVRRASVCVRRSSAVYQLRTRTFGLANALHARYGISESSGMFSAHARSRATQRRTTSVCVCAFVRAHAERV